MTYNERQQDLFSVSDEYYLVHCISADFGMGKGIVVEFNRRFDMKRKLRQGYPNYIDEYVNAKIGGYHKPTMNTMSLALTKMKEICEEKGIVKIAMPTIGAGLDRLNWNSVATLIKDIFKNSEIEILVCRQK